MLGDNPEKSKNPLKKAMRRRNAKTVNFAPPTYYEPEEREWSDEGANEVDEGPTVRAETNRDEAGQAQQSAQSQTVSSTKPVAELQGTEPVTASIHHIDSNEEVEHDEEEPSSPVKSDIQAPAPLQINSQEPGSRSRKGVIRNTDSFFRDDNVETKKISLTPRLLRGDSDSNVSGSTDQEVKQRPSLDGADRGSYDDKGKDNKKKEKKGMLSGLFKRKEKGGKPGKTDVEDTERISDDSRRSPTSKETMEGETTPDRKTGKLQKTPPSTVSPKQSPVEARAPQRDLISNTTSQRSSESWQPDSAMYGTSLDPSQSSNTSQQLSVPQQGPGRFPSLNEKRSVFAPITEALRPKNANQEGNDSSIKPVYSKRAKERFAIDDSDSDDGSTPTAQSSILHRSISPPDVNGQNTAITATPLGTQSYRIHSPDDAPGYETATTEAAILSEAKMEGGQFTTADTIATSPSERTTSTSKHSPSVATHTPSTSRSTPTWSDASLRSYMENDQDIRDLLVIVHDKSNVQPVGSDHPLMNGLFASERTKLADMQTQLDSMLMTWLAKKSPSIVAKA